MYRLIVHVYISTHHPMFLQTHFSSFFIYFTLSLCETMENKHMADSEDFSQDFGDVEDVLSLSNLPIHGYEHEEVSPRASTSSDQDPFEFFGGLGSEPTRSNSVVLWGKNIDQTDGDEVNEYQKRDYLCLKTVSFHKARDYNLDSDCGEFRPASQKRSSSLRCHSKQFSPVQKVNITALTSMSAKSRRRMFMFGPVKFKPEMDVTAIRKRQSLRPPMQIPPMPEGGEMVTSGGGRGKSDGDRGLLKPLWCRSHLATALAKSFGCISASMV